MWKAEADCAALWADPAFDRLRDKLALGTKPSVAMLTNPERLSPQDKPVADLALRTPPPIMLNMSTLKHLPHSNGAFFQQLGPHKPMYLEANMGLLAAYITHPSVM